MKYKNIELITGDDSEAELLCSVEFENAEEDEEIVEGMEDKLIELFEDLENEIDIEAVADTIIQVRCVDFTFDKEGVLLLKQIYDTLINAELDAKVSVNVQVDGDTWFKREDGSEYNEDESSFEEFIQNVEY